MFKELDLPEAGGGAFGDVVALGWRVLDVLFYDVQLCASVVHGNRMMEAGTQLAFRGYEEARVALTTLLFNVRGRPGRRWRGGAARGSRAIGQPLPPPHTRLDLHRRRIDPIKTGHADPMLRARRRRVRHLQQRRVLQGRQIGWQEEGSSRPGALVRLGTPPQPASNLRAPLNRTRAARLTLA